ncbi:four helix bundle protein [Desulfothermus naphthae]
MAEGSRDGARSLQIDKRFSQVRTYSLVDQIKRAAYSVPANIVHPVE